MNMELIFKKMLFFLIIMAMVGIILMGWIEEAGAFPPPTRKTIDALASWSQPLIQGFESMPDPATWTDGDLIFLSTPTPLLYRRQSAAWATASASLDNVATFTVSGSLIIGSGTPDCEIVRVATGTVRISSYTVIPPETATPTDLISGTLWNDSNTGKLRFYDGGSWRDLW